MVGELSSALPEEGGYYAWVRRALGPFWGFQEAWLSLVASIFDMAIYPTLLTLYLARLWPPLGDGPIALAIGLAMIAGCAAWNVGGARAVGGASLVMTVALLGPFVVLVLLALARPAAATTATALGRPDLVGGVLVAMWNYMGWDNASTIAGEVDRPQRTYPLAMMIAVSLVALTYVAPVAALGGRLDASSWTTGAWVDAGAAVGGAWLGRAIVLGGIVCAVGMFNALVMSYSRLPLVLAADGYLPSLVARRHPRSDAPWVAILLCATAYAFCLGLGFERLVELDVLLYGLSLVLEFAALVALRLREPSLARPFRVPGGLAGAFLVGVGPTALIGLALLHGRAERAGALSALAIGLTLVAAGPLLYALSTRMRVAPSSDLT
jgi:amino acid transporter